MVIYSVTSKQLVLNTTLLAILLGLIYVSYNELREYRDLPEVTFTDGKCTSVTNHNNGDAYNCNDVDVVLRKYRAK